MSAVDTPVTLTITPYTPPVPKEGVFQRFKRKITNFLFYALLVALVFVTVYLTVKVTLALTPKSDSVVTINGQATCPTLSCPDPPKVSCPSPFPTGDFVKNVERAAYERARVELMKTIYDQLASENIVINYSWFIKFKGLITTFLGNWGLTTIQVGLSMIVLTFVAQLCLWILGIKLTRATSAPNNKLEAKMPDSEFEEPEERSCVGYIQGRAEGEVEFSDIACFWRHKEFAITVAHALNVGKYPELRLRGREFTMTLDLNHVLKSKMMYTIPNCGDMIAIRLPIEAFSYLGIRSASISPETQGMASISTAEKSTQGLILPMRGLELAYYGSTEAGFSGAPYFDSAERVMGTHVGYINGVNMGYAARLIPILCTMIDALDETCNVELEAKGKNKKRKGHTGGSIQISSGLEAQSKTQGEFVILNGERYSITGKQERNQLYSVVNARAGRNQYTKQDRQLVETILRNRGYDDVYYDPNYDMIEYESKEPEIKTLSSGNEQRGEKVPPRKSHVEKLPGGKVKAPPPPVYHSLKDISTLPSNLKAEVTLSKNAKKDLHNISKDLMTSLLSSLSEMVHNPNNGSTSPPKSSDSLTNSPSHREVATQSTSH